jgi:deoxyribose-phosphate aldolase
VNSALRANGACVVPPNYQEIAKMIDHSMLTPSLTDRELERGCELAVRYDVASVCLMPYFLPRCVAVLRGSDVKASTTIGFPHGGHKTAVKMYEAEQAMADGADELDVVVNVSKVVSGDLAYVQDELAQLTALCHAHNRKIKVIFENSYLDRDAKIALCRICGEIQADWVKTSTGYASTGATLDDLELMRAHTPASVQLKASGGIRTLEVVLAARARGVSRVGTSRTAEILDECKRSSQPPAAPLSSS